MTTISDDFNRSDGALGANWSGIGGSPLVIASNRAANTSSGDYDEALYTATALGNDHYAQAKVNKIGSDVHYYDIKLRHSGASNPNGYRVSIGVRDGDWYITRVDAGSGTDIESGSTTAPSADDVLRGEVEGSTIRLYLNGVLLGSQTDSTYSTGGLTGLGAYSTGSIASFDDFDAGDLGGGGGGLSIPIALYHYQRMQRQ